MAQELNTGSTGKLKPTGYASSNCVLGWTHTTPSNEFPRDRLNNGIITLSSSAVRIYAPRHRHMQFIRFPVFIPMKKDLPPEHFPVFGARVETSTFRYGAINSDGWGWWPSSINHTLVGIPTELVTKIYIVALVTRNPRLINAYKDSMNYSVSFDPEWYAWEYHDRRKYLESIRHKQRDLCLLMGKSYHHNPMES